MRLENTEETRYYGAKLQRDRPGAMTGYMGTDCSIRTFLLLLFFFFFLFQGRVCVCVWAFVWAFFLPFARVLLCCAGAAAI